MPQHEETWAIRCPRCGASIEVRTAAVRSPDYFMEWIAWRERQPGPTCDHIGCYQKVAWKLPRQGFHFCEEHGEVERLKSLYAEEPIRL